MINTFDSSSKIKNTAQKTIVKIEDLSPKAVQLELLKIAKENNKKLESIKINVQFFTWITIIGIVIYIYIIWH